MGIKRIIFFFQILCFSSFEAYPSGKNTTLVSEILHDRTLLRKSNVVTSIWEGEPSTLCDIQKPSESMLLNKVFIEFSHVPVLCMVLFDASLQYLQLNTSLNEDTKFNYTEIIDGTSTNTICQKMTKNVWSTTIGENEKWVSKFNDLIKNENSCRGYCVTQIVNPLCPLVLWLDKSVKQAKQALSETKYFKNPGNGIVENPSDTNFKTESFPADTRTDHTHSPTIQTDDDRLPPSKDTGLNNNIIEGKVQSFTKWNKVISKNGSDEAFNHFSQDSGQVSSASKLVYPTGNQKPPVINVIPTPQGVTIAHLPSGDIPKNSEKDGTRKKPLTKSPSAKLIYVSGANNVTPNDYKPPDSSKTKPSPEDERSVKGGSSSTPSLVEVKEPVSVGKSNDKPEDVKTKLEGIYKTPEGPVTDQGKMIGVSAQVTEPQKTVDISAAADVQKILAPVSAPFPKHTQNNNPGKDTPLAPGIVPLPELEGNNSPGRVNTTDPEAKEKEKTGISKGHIADPIDISENDEVNQADIPEFDGESVVEPDDHEDQKKLDDGAMGGQVEDGNHLRGHGEANPPPESEDDTVDIQDITAEPRFNEMEEGSPPKPDPSTKVEDYAGTSDEDDDSQWHPDQGRVTQNDADAGYAHDRFVDAEDSHFFAYFMTMIILCILGYIIFHNKQKILALALEGRARKGSRRRPSTSGYRKLDSNLEEAVTSNCTGSSVTHVIY